MVALSGPLMLAHSRIKMSSLFPCTDRKGWLLPDNWMHTGDRARYLELPI